MNFKIKDLMSQKVLSLRPQDTVGQAKKIFKENNINVLPIINNKEELIGIISQSDILTVDSPWSHVCSFMTHKVLTVPEYSDIQIAAQIMRKHHIHHLVVTHEHKVVGIVSSYDLLTVISEHRFKAINFQGKTNKRVA